MTTSPTLLRFNLAQRRRDARVSRIDGIAPLAALADSLSDELEPLLLGALPIPPQKARLTRGGGRCPVHGTLLEFDPWSPHEHRCDRCDVAYRGREHDDWWAMGAQLWTVERAVHAATLFALRGDVEHAALASRILQTLAQQYTSWPNRDNVLGPSRPFFSTYLESIWLLNACHALSLLERAQAPGIQALGNQVRDQLLAPSAALIGDFHEGTSNRQVWNEVSVLSARHLLGDDHVVKQRLDARGGLPWLVEHGLLSDGTWYEGENYHMFAHRGLWYGTQLLAAMDRPLPTVLDARYRAGFVTPFFGVLPDDTLPSRRDSQYAISIRQWRFAEWLELGYAHSIQSAAPDARVATMLTRLYDNRCPRHETGRRVSTADAERNTEATALTRADLSWRALLMADAESAPHGEWLQTSGVLREQGLAVLRRDGARTYVALEGGHTGGGHGHPDALALTLQSADARWLDDPGTGSYTERALHWYRSTIAHAAPLIDRASQQRVPTELLAFEDRGAAGWIWKRAKELAVGVTVERTIVVTANYLVDVLEWSSDASREITLPIAGAARLVGEGLWMPAAQHGAGGVEDGFDFLRDVESVPMCSTLEFRVDAAHANPAHATATAASTARVWYASSHDGLLVRAMAPGAPGHAASPRHWLQVSGRSGRIVGVWSWPSSAGTVNAVRLDAVGMPCATVQSDDGTTAAHSRAAHGWHIDLHAQSARSTIELGGLLATTESRQTPRDADLIDEPTLALVIPTVSAIALNVRPGTPIIGALQFELDEPHYVRTELPWVDAGAPTATVQIATTAVHFIVDIDARTGAMAPTSDLLENPLDNERTDTNADGVQWYLGDDESAAWTAGGLIVPILAGVVRATTLVARSHVTPEVEWKVTATGWAMRLRWHREQLPRVRDGRLLFDVIINERSPDGERRRGQLVLSGGGGFGYLRGDRHEPSRALRVVLT